MEEPRSLVGEAGVLKSLDSFVRFFFRKPRVGIYWQFEDRC
jgi:hypothetical protein